MESDSQTVEIKRDDFKVESEPGIDIAVRKVVSDNSDSKRAIVLLHGARVPSVPSYDLQVEGGSLAADLARKGLTVFLMDARGYGYSTRPEPMNRENDGGDPLVRTDEVYRDIDAVIAWITSFSSGQKPYLLGWATGGMWVGHYASLNSHKLQGLVLYNPLYGGVDGHPTWGAGSKLEDPERPGYFNRKGFGTYRLCGREDILAKWDKSFPGEELDDCRDPAVARAYVEATLDSDVTSVERSPRAFRAPSGALEDSFYAVRGRQLYDASLIRCSVLIIRCTADFLARESELNLLRRHLVSAERMEYVEISGASHYAHLDRPVKGRNRVISALVEFAGL